jgi:ATPase subunit of ABC transporter with duplicated ATPase domains
LFLRETASPIYAMPFTSARIALADTDAAQARQFENDMAKADQLRRQAAKLKNIGINSGSDLLITKTKQLKDRADKIEATARPAHTEGSAGAIRLNHADTHARALVAFDDVTIETPDGRALFRTGPLWVNKGDRVVILGPNGAGKSRMLALVIAALAGDMPGVRIASAAVPGIADQGLTHLAAHKTPWDAVTHRFDVGDQRARALLAGAGMDIALQSAPITALSGGQRARLAMLILRLTHPNLYILDEPTNHLDIDGQEALEEELQSPEASGLLVSHDRTFVRQTGTRFWEIRGKRLVEVDSPEPFFAASLLG